MRMKPVMLVSAVMAVFLLSCSESFKGVKNFDNNAGVVINIKKQPVLKGKVENEAVTINVPAFFNKKRQVSMKRIDIKFERSATIENLLSIKVFHHSGEPDLSDLDIFGIKESPSFNNRIRGNILLKDKGENIIISFNPVEKPYMNGKIIIKSIRILFSGRKPVDIKLSAENSTIRFGQVLRAAGQDNCDTYRIPGLITTNSGTLIAVYDNRYNRSKDLQEDIDIGMSRSTDGGETWEPMKVIMDMDEYGGRPERLNGIGDPCLLYDHINNAIWVAALWMSGASHDDMLWFASKPGMDPEVTGQFIIVKSTDDGISWSDPVNITGQIKDPSWQLLLQGPGRGITTKDGTLVFPAQFKADLGVPALDGGKYSCHSTIVYSKDNGKTWHIGSGAKPNTTESQVVELSDGSLMLNMRDDLNRKDKGETNGRAVCITSDLGLTWTRHSSSNSLLPEPNCMASLIATDLYVDGVKKRVLFFSNPDNKNARSNMTIKASLDEGLTWPEKYQMEIYEPDGFGYSCLTMVDEKTVGILYEGSKELYFQKIPLRDIINEVD